jgi:hypothetical protein
MAKKPKQPLRRPIRYIYRAWRYGKGGKRLYARDYGYRAWRIPIYPD